MVEARSSERVIWHGAATIASAIASWVCLSAVIGLTLTLVTIEWTVLGPLFIPRIMSAWALASLAAALPTYGLKRSRAKRSKSSKGEPLTGKQLILLAFVGLLMISAVLIVGTVRRELAEKNNATAAEVARDRFTMTLYPSLGPEFNPEAVNQTLRELEDSYQRLHDLWVLPDAADKIKIWLFRTVDDYQAITGNDDAGGHAMCPSESGPVVVIPVEKAPSVENDDHLSRTPIHEMIHALMCQSLGNEAFYSVPRWFHEGIAERYEMEGIARMIFRVEKRAILWLNRHFLMAPDRFCAIRLQSRGELESALFYETSREFVNSLAARHGLEALNVVVDDVRMGETFNSSMENRLGGTCNDLYMQWKSSL